jgi:hypothetical protein
MRGTFGYAAFNRNLERLAQAEYESALVLNPLREVNHPGHPFPSPTRDSIAVRFCPVLRSATSSSASSTSSSTVAPSQHVTISSPEIFWSASSWLRLSSYDAEDMIQLVLRKRDNDEARVCASVAKV